MKLIFCIQFLLLIAQGSYAQENEISDRQHAYINRFIDAVRSHSEKKVYKLLDKNYRKEQNKFLGGNKTQLLNELFGGNDIDSDQFQTILLGDIVKIEVAEVILETSGDYTYIFRVRDDKHDILTSLLLLKRGKKYGFAGAMG